MKHRICRLVVCTLAVVLFLQLMSINVLAGTTHTQEEAIEWAKAQVGKSLDFDQEYGAQCVDLITYYYQYLGVKVVGGHAIDYKSNTLPSGWKRVYNDYQPGDIAVWYANHSCKSCYTGEYGHIAIITSVDGSTLHVIDQNGPTNKGVCKANVYPASAIQCVIRPDFTKDTENQPTFQVTNTGATSITETTARINAKLSPGANVSEIGFYLGTSPDNMQQKVESTSTYVESIWYDLGTGKWSSALQPNTTYYYQIYAIINGTTYKSSVDSFTTKTNTSSGRVVNTGVTSLTETTARINAKLSPGANVSELGFYWGTSPDNMQKKVESTTTYVESIWYDLGTGKWTGALQPGTTYYYQIYAIVNGVTHKSTIDSFTTTARNYNLYVNPNGGVFSDGSSDVVTANPQLIYGGSNWYDISGFQASRNGYTLDGWYNAATGGTKVYNADGLTCNEGYYWKDNYYVYTGDLSIYAQWTDVTKPVVTNVRVGELSSEGYTVYCDVTDNEGIERVCFPTWTDANGQDDLIQDWYNNAKSTGVSGNTYSFRVNISDHNNERGSYTTHIYAYDFKGNHEYAGTVVVVPKYVPFPDVKVGAWYYNSVAEVYEKGYMSGRGDGTFGPDIYLTRAEIATVLYNMENKPSVAYSNKFSDVADGQWYSKPISWAYRNDIASGYGNGKFGVGDKITREQMAQMLYAYARMKGYDISYTDGLINQYGDSNKVSNWAKPAMNWAISKGIMSGKGSGSDLSQYKLDPTGNTTRAECAAMLKNFMDAYEKK